MWGIVAAHVASEETVMGGGGGLEGYAFFEVSL